MNKDGLCQTIYVLIVLAQLHVRIVLHWLMADKGAKAYTSCPINNFYNSKSIVLSLPKHQPFMEPWHITKADLAGHLQRRLLLTEKVAAFISNHSVMVTIHHLAELVDILRRGHSLFYSLCLSSFSKKLT